MLAGSGTHLVLPPDSHVIVTSVLGDVRVTSVLLLLLQVQRVDAITVITSLIGGRGTRRSVGSARANTNGPSNSPYTCTCSCSLSKIYSVDISYRQNSCIKFTLISMSCISRDFYIGLMLVWMSMQVRVDTVPGSWSHVSVTLRQEAVDEIRIVLHGQGSSPSISVRNMALVLKSCQRGQ